VVDGGMPAPDTATPDSIRAELAQNGFAVESLWNDLTGTPYAEPSDWIGVVARRQ